MRAVNSIETNEQLEGIDFKTYAEFCIKMEINTRIEEGKLL
jgi:DNA-directed RNA polymerase specialized sigma subunit